MVGGPSRVPEGVHFTLGLMVPVLECGFARAQQRRGAGSPCACLHIDPDVACFYLTEQFFNENLYCSAQSPS